MKKIAFILGIASMTAIFLPSCKKKSTETTVVSKPPYQVGQPITAGSLAAGSYKGTMTTGNSYTLTGDFTINKGDTVLIQPGVNVYVADHVTIIVKGVLLSLGTQSQPIMITSTEYNTTAKHINVVGANPATDPAYSGAFWTGINCDTSCTLLDIRWTHIEFAGGPFPYTEPFVGGTSGKNSFNVLFQNPKGDIIIEDSWVYGGVDDCFRIQQGRLYIARNTFEKIGYIGGDGVNAKHGSQGDMCYNLFIGSCTNSTKASDKGAGPYVQCNINMYNNTYVDCGYRQASPSSRGSDIDYEQGARGLCYNNLIINCRNGIRVGDGQNGIPMPDTANTFIGYNYIYADSLLEVNQFFPVVAGTWTKPSAYIYPSSAQLSLPVGFYAPPADDMTYNSPSCVAANNPMFVNFSLPETGISTLADITTIATGNYDFHLKAGSPAIGKGYVSFIPFTNIPNPVSADVTNSNFAPGVSFPGVDIGCYQTNGNGNAH